MNFFRHALATLTRRLRWEIAVFALLVSAHAFAAISMPGTSSGWSSIVILMFWWLTLRIVLSETGHPTFGGWRTRPFSPNAILFARVFLLGALAAVAGVVRFFTLWHLFHPTTAQWIDHLGIIGSSVGLPWLVFAAGLALIALFRRFPLQARSRKAGGAALVIAAVVAVGWTLRSGSRHESYRSSGNVPKLDAAIQRALPQAKRFIGPWNVDRASSETGLVQPVLRITLASWTGNPARGVRLLDLRHSAEGGTVRVALKLSVLDAGVARQLSAAVPVLGFADGSYGASVSFEDGEWSRFQPTSSGQPRLEYLITFASPLSLPENRDADAASFPPTEILFFAPVLDFAVDAAPSGSDAEPVDASVPGPGSIPPPENASEFRHAVTALIDGLAVADEPSADQLSRIAELPPEAIVPILAYHPWPETAWEKMVRPLLLRHAAESDKPALLTRLATDERLGGVFIEKGWADDALPVLRQRAIDRLPLDAESLTLLANQNDPVLAPHLAALAVRLWGIEKLAPTLRESLGFDWPAFVALGWKSRKFLEYDRQGWHYANWAAELGDPSAFLRLAEEAARGKKWETERLAELVTGEHTDLIGFVRENLERLRYDSETRKWGL